MAKSNAEYFSHDTDASLDEKIIYLESLFGDSGYAWFFKMLETLGRANDFEIEWSELKCGVLARKFNTTQQEFNKFIVAATNPDVRAFVIENGKLYSPGLKHRLEKMLDRRKKEAERIAEKRAKYSVDATGGEVDATGGQSKVKERKVKESNIKREREAPNAADKIENEKNEEGQKETTPPVAPAPSPSDTAYSWAAGNLDFLKAAKEQAAFDGKVKDQVLKFCAHYSEHDAFCNQPVKFFKNKFAAWLITARENAAKFKPRKRIDRQRSAADQITREKVLEHIKAAHGAFAGEITERDVSTLIQCADMPAMRERCAEIVKAKMNDTNFQTARNCEATLAGLMGKIGQA